jgi:DNA-binding response OmpR family regulator
MANSKPTIGVIGKINANILIIEDDAETTEMVSLFLIHEGYGVRSVFNRDDALKILDSYLYDIIIMDLCMVGMGPVEFLKRAKLKFSRSKVILITAGAVVKNKAEELGVAAFIGKPFLPEQLLEVIKSCSPNRDTP